MADEPVTPTSAPTAPDVPVKSETPAAPITPLDQAPLSEFVARRAKGETQATQLPLPAETPATPDDTEGDVPAEPGKPELAGSKKPQNFKQRFDQIYRQRSEALRERDEVRAHNERLVQELTELKRQAPQQPQPPSEVKPPNLDEYIAAGKTYEDWLDARDEFRFQQKYRGELQRMLAEREQQLVMGSQMAGFAERTEAAKAKYQDYDAVVVQNDRVQLSPVMQDIARRSPHGPDIMYWLGTHEAEANQLGELTANYPPASFPLVEAHLLLLSGQQAQQGNGQTGAKKAVAVSQAPAPITPVGGGSSTSSMPLDQMSLGDFVKRRNADLKRRTGP